MKRVVEGEAAAGERSQLGRRKKRGQARRPQAEVPPVGPAPREDGDGWLSVLEVGAWAAHASVFRSLECVPKQHGSA